MEDTIVKPGHYAYQFRVDLPSTDMTLVMEFIQKYEISFYIIASETSSLGKQHFQCILWSPITQNTTKLRNWWKGKCSDTKQPVSITSAKKIKSLAKYTMKDNKFFTNLTKDEVKMIGQWDRKIKDTNWKDLLFKTAQEYVPPDHITGTYTLSHDRAILFDFMEHMLELYKKNNKRPARSTLNYLGWKYGYISNNQLIDKWF